mmetsp:Transcript_3650/g.9817  ORF Transcript_3650/g.9817 Transcript_3650/m.9817 type:complete len:298 (-) Transcript_3650:150-1043(-)
MRGRMKELAVLEPLHRGADAHAVLQEPGDVAVEHPAVPPRIDYGYASARCNLEGRLVRPLPPQRPHLVVILLDLKDLAHEVVFTHCLRPEEDDARVEGILESHVFNKIQHDLDVFRPVRRRDLPVLVDPRSDHHRGVPACAQEVRHGVHGADVVVQVENLIDAPRKENAVRDEAQVVRTVLDQLWPLPSCPLLLWLAYFAKARKLVHGRLVDVAPRIVGQADDVHRSRPEGFCRILVRKAAVTVLGLGLELSARLLQAAPPQIGASHFAAVDRQDSESCCVAFCSRHLAVRVHEAEQ